MKSWTRDMYHTSLSLKAKAKGSTTNNFKFLYLEDFLKLFLKSLFFFSFMLIKMNFLSSLRQKQVDSIRILKIILFSINSASVTSFLFYFILLKACKICPKINNKLICNIPFRRELNIDCIIISWYLKSKTINDGSKIRICDNSTQFFWGFKVDKIN